MKIKEGFVVRKVGKESVVVGESLELIDFNHMIGLNDSALLIWNAFEGKEFELDDAVGVIVNHYDIDQATAAADVSDLLQGWKKYGLLE